MNFEPEIVAEGELFKQGSVAKNWNLRKFELCGVLLTYYDDETGEKKGDFDISKCTLKRMTPEEVSTPQAQFAFALEKPDGKKFVATANNESCRVAWLKVLENQISEFSAPERRFVYSNEIVHAKGVLIEKKMRALVSKTVFLVVTNSPRLLIIDLDAMTLKSQMTWNAKQPPKFEKV